MTPESWARRLVCTRTGEGAPLDRPAFVSPAGAPWTVEYEPPPGARERLLADLPSRPWTLWRYRELLPPVSEETRVDLGEGGTPLIRVRRAAPDGVDAWIKDEGGNPTGSFKARGLSLAVNRAKELGAPGVQLPSAGNAGVALAAYAAAAGLPARVAVPEGTPGRIECACLTYGAEVHRVGATLVDSGAWLRDQGGDHWDLSTLKEPYRAEGKKTMGLELAEQMGWRLPDWVVYPTGGGTGIVGMASAFRQLRELGLVEGPGPRFAVVQMEGCAPIVRAFHEGAERARPWAQAETGVWGLRVPAAIGDFLVLRALRESGGAVVAVPEADLVDVADRLARHAGVAPGLEGAAAWRGMELLAAQGTIRPGQRVVVFQTGSPGNYA